MLNRIIARHRVASILFGTAALIAPITSATDAPGPAPSTVDFVRDVQPIFEQNCYKCHGPDKQKGQLRFDSRESLFHGGQSGPTVNLGHADESRLIHRVLGLDGDDRMPLKEKALSEDQIVILKAWIDQGAVFPESASVANAKIQRHWAYSKPVRPEIPSVKAGDWCRNPIDNFIEARLEKEGLAHSPPADRATLIRRVSLDLIGLPPTISQVDDFVNDKSADAYDKVVDRLLASPHYGERWAMPWLDMARYADSEGYERDPLRSMWPYRDWVIDALNNNMPFDQFTIEQLAGDLLPNATDQQKIATGFHRNTMINREAGSDPGEYFYYALVDRVNTTSSVWLGTTMACAQCHNHKYDPFTQKDFYRLMAFFNGTADEAKQVGGSEIDDISPKLAVEETKVKDLRIRLTALHHQLETTTPQLAASQAIWEQRASRKIEWKPLNVRLARAEGSTLSVQPDGTILASGALPANDTYTISGDTTLEKITGVELEILPDDSLPSHGPGRAPNGNIALTHFAMDAAPMAEDRAPVAVHFSHATADTNQENWPVEKSITDKSGPDTGWAILPETGKRHVAVFETSSDVTFDNGTSLTFTLEHKSIAGTHLIGRLRISVTDAPRSTGIASLPEKINAILAVTADQRTPAQADELAAFYRSIAPELVPLRDQIPILEKQIAEATATTLVMVEMPQPRETHIHIRGGYLALGDKVEPAVPAIFSGGSTNPADPSSPRLNRLDLARWLVGSDNPLTARVTMNRLWEQYFGIGIVKTSEDFGSQGEPPTNQGLLDWLGCELQSRHWDLKQMHRLVVTSAAYQQSSDVTPEVQERDPYNRLLARGPRFRLPAEMLRDQALTASGLLSEKVGGPSVFPLQPEGIWRSPYSGDRWVTSPGEDRFRRGVYTFVRRSSPYPQFAAFDMTPHEISCTRRSRTNTPLQALTALNDPAFMQPAASLARRAMKEGGNSAQTRAAFIFRSVVAREPRGDEVNRLADLQAQVLKSYKDDAAAATKMADSGLGDLPKEISIPDLAAWTVVANTVLNLDEALTKG